MTTLKGASVQAFVKKRDNNIGAVLLYGPDGGLVRERGEALARSVVADFTDPFNYIELTDADLKAEPARLADEAAALSFAGGERVVRLRTAGEAAAKAAQNLIDGLDGGYLAANALVVLEAGELSPRSGLRKMFEKAKRAAALPCYADGPADIRALAIEAARSEALSFDDDALDLVVATLGEDRGVSRSEIDKLVLFKGLKEHRQGPDVITLDDVRTLLVDGVGDVMDEAAAAAADGAAAALAKALHRAASAGASPVGLLRALQRSFTRLYAAQLLVAGGAAPRDAMKKLKPPVFFAEERAFEARLQRWSLGRLRTALDLLLEAEFAAKKTGAPQRECVERAALRLSKLAQR